MEPTANKFHKGFMNDLTEFETSVVRVVVYPFLRGRYVENPGRYAENPIVWSLRPPIFVRI